MVDVKANPEHWVRDSARATTREEQNRLLQEILTAGPRQLSALERLVRSPRSPALFRTAALDQYLKLAGSAKGQAARRDGRRQLLERLSKPETEADCSRPAAPEAPNRRPAAPVRLTGVNGQPRTRRRAYAG
jgi:hypothetical protein